MTRDPRLARAMRRSIVQGHPDIADTLKALWASRWALLLIVIGILVCSLDTQVTK